MQLDAFLHLPQDLLQTQVPAVYVRLLAKGDPGGDKLLEGTGLDLDNLKTATHVTLNQQLQVMANYAATSGDPAWALKFGSRISLNTLGPLGIAAVSAPTLRDGIGIWDKYLSIRTAFIATESRIDGDLLHLHSVSTLPLDALEPTLMEMVMQVAQTYVETFTESPIQAAKLRFRYPKPSYGDLYGQWFHCPVAFAAGVNELIIPAQWADLASPLHDPLMWQTSLAECAALLTSREAGDTTRHTVKRLIREALDRHPGGDQYNRIPSASEVAAHLHITNRTLIRRLKRAQTSYQALRDEVVKERVDYLLTATKIPIADIGARVGYRDPANFGRVCRRWFGKSPGSVRARATSKTEPPV
ncbi:AraC family transcriptional regulator [Exilibacterium tricleocarpae]|uniref:AraC family transcriptional regulator n=1 Tax=Exilibacterium tricleocarpae TaxID=2591008 RepID=A0A545U3I6_9GAMM|nr:AraC family transcriptional regulator [Exilibacterium tricleocarpae]TQV84028.1 AraC family transcriptional regulator [Exilibacterium tricleocarpae]